MPSSSPSRYLQTGSDARALAQEKAFDTMVRSAFNNNTILANQVLSGGTDNGETPSFPRMIAIQASNQSKSKTFPIYQQVTGDEPEYHEPGVEMLGKPFVIAERNITIDEELVMPRELAILDQALTYFPMTAPTARNIGHEIAANLDKKLFIIGVKAARTAAVTNIHNGGNLVSRTAATLAAAYPVDSTGAGNLRDDVDQLALQMDEDNVPENGRWLFMPPRMRTVLQKDTVLYNRDFSVTNNDLNRRVVGIMSGFNVVFTNHLPSTTIASGGDFNPTSDADKYAGDFAVGGAEQGQPAALALCGAEAEQAAIGLLTGPGGMETTYLVDKRRRTIFMNGVILLGAGVLNPWCAGAIHVHS